MKTSPYIYFNGKCEEAFKFYEHCVGAQILSTMRYAAAPADMPISPESRDKVMHGRIRIGDTLIMASDAPAERYQKPQGFSLTLLAETPADADRIFAKLSDKGSVVMPLAETFFAHRFGMLVDRFDIPWMVICEKG